MYEFNVYFRGTKLIAGPAIWAKSLTAARQILKQQEGVTAKVFDVAQAA